MTFTTFIDSAYPLNDYPHADGFAFFAGGDTPHIWSEDEVKALPYRYLLPIFVQSNPGNQDEATADANAFLNKLAAYGAPRHTLVALDFETAVNVEYVAQFSKVITEGEFSLILYGSESFVHRNNMPDGLYWGADWTRVNHIHSGDAGTQWISLNAYDESTFTMNLPLWDTHPDSPPGKTITAVPVDFPWKRGDKGNRVRAIQALAGAKRGHDLACDGIYGAATETLVRGVQVTSGIKVDGIVGPETWKALLD